MGVGSSVRSGAKEVRERVHDGVSSQGLGVYRRDWTGGDEVCVAGRL